MKSTIEEKRKPLKEAGPKDGPQSALGRGIRVLQCFSTAEPDLSGKDLVERTGLPKATLFRIIASLKDLGLLRYSERRGKFTLAPGVLALAAPVLASMPIRQLARPLMQELADYAHGQVSLAVGEGSEFLYVELLQGAGSTVYRPEIGTAASLARTASGRAYLTCLEPEMRAALVRCLTGEDAEKEQWLTQRLQETEHDLATMGFCRNKGELDRDVLGVAVPARAPMMDGQLFVFGVSVPAFHMTQKPDLLNDIGMRLASLVRSVETALGK